MTATILLVDDTPALMEMFAAAVTARRGHRVIIADRIDLVEGIVETSPPIDMALVDLSFPHQDGTGLDVLEILSRCSPKTRLVILTSGDGSVAHILRDAWELLPIASVISKTAPLELQLGAIEEVLGRGSAPVDPAIQMLLPSTKSPFRSAERFAKLVPHAGHAKLWAALLNSPTDMTYKQLADATGLRLNTIKNYRASLVDELALHGLDDPGLGQMREFARRCRAFLWPHVEAALERAR